ncbi:hypothetical protein [Megalodesulfovibrio gigas]|uniref:hypothetical protein n=1 Tax=Megalodesulfovibrio gigas TaxID=879 RepID=UPI000427F983|nr:hypothetical protein [Megalodesulfovibrio gigas]
MRQLSLFENQLPDVEPLLKAAMHRAAKRCGLSREQIVDKMNEIAAIGGYRLNRNARALTLDVFEKWLNPAERDYVPGHNAVHAFVLAVNDPEPLRVTSGLHGYELVGGEDLKILRAAKIDREIKNLKRQKRRLEQEL